MIIVPVKEGENMLLWALSNQARSKQTGKDTHENKRRYKAQISKMKDLKPKFTPYSKLSKKKKRERDNSRRKTWGALDPVTRRAKPPKAYDRAKVKKEKEQWDGNAPEKPKDGWKTKAKVPKWLWREVIISTKKLRYVRLVIGSRFKFLRRVSNKKVRRYSLIIPITPVTAVYGTSGGNCFKESELATTSRTKRCLITQESKCFRRTIKTISTIKAQPQSFANTSIDLGGMIWA